MRGNYSFFKANMCLVLEKTMVDAEDSKSNSRDPWTPKL